jgi:tetratricopeptide (TPR) repeat protein
MPRDLQTDMATLRTILNYAEQRDFERAGAMAERALASGFEHPMLLNIAATRLEQEGKLEASLRLLERAVSIAPNDLGARNALGLVLQRLDRPAEALRHIDVLLKQHANLAFLHASKGNALIALGALGSARQSHLRALDIEPRNLAAMAALGSIATHRGQHAEARQWAERTLEIAPGFPDAVLSLAAADLADGDLKSAETRLAQLIVDSRAGPTDRAQATGLLADVFHAAGRYPDALEAYTTCNQALRQIHSRFAGSNLLGYTRATIAALERLDGAAWRARGDAAGGDAAGSDAAGSDAQAGEAGHVFLIGFPRSGTTLLEVVLDGSPLVVSLEERELLAEGVLAFMREPVDFEPLARAGDLELKRLREVYWQRVRSAGVQVAGKVFIDKHPLNTQKLPLIAKLFPRAKILFALRDPRDVLLSCFRRRFKMNPSMYELLTLPGAATFYDAVMTFADTARHRLGLEWYEVRYERLIADFEQEMRAVCAHIGVTWEAGMGDFAERVQAREYATPSTAQLSQGLITSATAQWRHYEQALREVTPLLKPWLDRFGYA